MCCIRKNVCAVAFPSIRAICRYKKDINPIFQPRIVKEDVASGFVLPQYIEIALVPFNSNIQPNATALLICVFYTIYLITDLTDNGRSLRMRTRCNDPKY